MTKVYNKLVRDGIPRIIAEGGNRCATRILDAPEYLEALDAKLTEELAEYQQRKSLEELADLLEVMLALVRARGHTWQELEQLRQQKAAARGGFDERIFLLEVTEQASSCGK